MSDLPQKQKDFEITLNPHEPQHLCPACEDELSSAKASVVKQAGRAVVWTPLAISTFGFIDSLNRHVAWVPDERIITTALIGLGAVIAFAFPTKEGTLGAVLQDRLTDLLRKKKEK